MLEITNQVEFFISIPKLAPHHGNNCGEKTAHCTASKHTLAGLNHNMKYVGKSIWEGNWRELVRQTVAFWKKHQSRYATKAFGSHFNKMVGRDCNFARQVEADELPAWECICVDNAFCGMQLATQLFAFTGDWQVVASCWSYEVSWDAWDVRKLENKKFLAIFRERWVGRVNVSDGYFPVT